MYTISIFDKYHRKQLQNDILSGKIDSDNLLPDLLKYVECEYYNLFCNLNTGEHSAIPVSRRGNAQWALRQSFKKTDLARILKKSKTSEQRVDGIYSHLFFMTLNIDHNLMTRDNANRFITSAGQGMNRFFARFEKAIEGGYAKIMVKESTKSGYPAPHIVLYLNKPLKVKWHRRSNTYRPDPSDPYTKSVLGKMKNLKDWNSPSPMWKVGFLDIYGFVDKNIGIRGYANPINYISKYLTKSLDALNIPELKTAKKVSELPEKYRTAVWTILNNVLWNSQTWVISKKFREALKMVKERCAKAGSDWMWVDTVHRDNPRLMAWMGYETSMSNIPPPSC